MQWADYLCESWDISAQVSHGLTLCLPETLTALVIFRHALGMTVLSITAFLNYYSVHLEGMQPDNIPCNVPVYFHVWSFFQFPKRGNCKCKDFKEVLKVHLGFRWVNLTKGFKNVSRSHFTLKSSQSFVANTHKDEDEQGIPEYIALFTKSIHRISQEKPKPHMNTNVNENRTKAAETQGV